MHQESYLVINYHINKLLNDTKLRTKKKNNKEMNNYTVRKNQKD